MKFDRFQIKSIFVGKKISTTRNLFHRAPAAALLVVLFIGNGCSIYRLHAPEHPGVTDSSEVVWSWAWGLVPGIPQIDCQGQPLAEVTVKSHFGFDLLSVLSLGLASPKRVEWKCAGATPGEGTIEIPLAGAGEGS